ncbi:hypothetical protein [Pseudomonas sp. GL-B-16]|uniref:hypothetical protein n=1 Tax=Pseudomonas sp. GL-B-16 TaxID=2832373 RepID=UPI001CC0E691|nr:hypothetical protein [Pseudomonas sp. GL-B-16]
MSALRKAQWRYDNAGPEDDSAHQEAAQAWIEDKAEQLVMGADVLVRQCYGPLIGVRQDQFATKVQEHLVQRQIDGMDDEDWFAQIVLSAFCGGNVKSCAERLLGPSDHSRGKLYEIAEAILEQYAHDGVAAEAEDNAL